MEVDEVPRSSGRFNLDRVAQEHMNEWLEVRDGKDSEEATRVRGAEGKEDEDQSREWRWMRFPGLVVDLI